MNNSNEKRGRGRPRAMPLSELMRQQAALSENIKINRKEKPRGNEALMKLCKLQINQIQGGSIDGNRNV